jgi:hypothetical protein
MIDAVKRLGDIDPWMCRSHVVTNFGPAAMADAYLNMYSKILNLKEPANDPVLARD